MTQSNFRKYLDQLKSAKSDEVGPGVRGELRRLARLATHCQAPAERKEVIAVLRAKGRELGIDVSADVEAINYPVGSPYRIK